MKENKFIQNDNLKDYSIYLENISFSYDKKTTIDDISLKINKGEKVALLGHNGSGKSTLLKLIDGILTPSIGDIYINGYLLNDDSGYFIRKNIGFVFQNPDSQFIGTTVKDDIIFSLENEQVDPLLMDEIIDKSLIDVDMLEYKDREALSLSGGQKQRVNLASIFALNKEILLLDEAKSMLDPKGKKQIDKLLDEKYKKNNSMTIISITHDTSELDFFDRVILLDNGKIVFDGGKDELFYNQDLIDKYHVEVPLIYKLSALDESLKEKDNIKDVLDSLCQLK